MEIILTTTSNLQSANIVSKNIFIDTKMIKIKILKFIQQCIKVKVKQYKGNS